jgi:hypothetical protein
MPIRRSVAEPKKLLNRVLLIILICPRGHALLIWPWRSKVAAGRDSPCARKRIVGCSSVSRPCCGVSLCRLDPEPAREARRGALPPSSAVRRCCRPAMSLCRPWSRIPHRLSCPSIIPCQRWPRLARPLRRSLGLSSVPRHPMNRRPLGRHPCVCPHRNSLASSFARRMPVRIGRRSTRGSRN